MEGIFDSDLPEGERNIRLKALRERFRIENVYELARQTAVSRRQKSRKRWRRSGNTWSRWDSLPKEQHCRN